MRFLVRLFAVLLGLLVAAFGLVLAIEVAWAWLRPGNGSLLVPWSAARENWGQLTWNDPAIRVVAGVLAVVGIVLLVVAAAARRSYVRLHDPAPEVVVITSPRSLARLVGHRVRSEDGVSSASVTASAKRVRVRATSRLHDPGQLRGNLTEVAQNTVDELPMPRKPEVSVSVDTPQEHR